MNFVVTSDFKPGARVYPGMIITYNVYPLLGIKMNWMTEITQVKEGQYFVDEQRFGPYALWHHQHHFKAVEGGVLMTDILHYDIGKWIFGWIAGQMFVHKKVQEIFDFRYKALEKYFATPA